PQRRKRETRFRLFFCPTKNRPDFAGRFFLESDVSCGRVRNAECAEYDVYDPECREHYEHSDEAVKDLLFAEVSFLSIRRSFYELEYSEEEDKESNSEREEDQWV